MNKLQMVQNMILTEIRRVGICSIDDEKLQEAWNIADKMQAEADKREKEESEKKRKEMRELLSANNTFIEKEGQHFDDVEWQPDWSQAPYWAKWWAMDLDGEGNWFSYEPISHNSVNGWILGNDGDGDDNIYLESINFGYTGDWRNSLRKRPEQCITNVWIGLIPKAY